MVRNVRLGIQSQTQCQNAVNARGKRRRLVQREARSQQRGFKQEHDQVLDRLVILVRLNLGLERLDDAVLGVDFHRLLGRHVRRHGRVTQRLRLHDALHVGRPAKLASDQAARRVDDAARHDNLFDASAQNVLDSLAQVFVRGLLLFHGLLFVFVFQLQAFLGGADQLLAIVFLELLDGVLINGVNLINNVREHSQMGLRTMYKTS